MTLWLWISGIVTISCPFVVQRRLVLVLSSLVTITGVKNVYTTVNKEFQQNMEQPCTYETKCCPLELHFVLIWKLEKQIKERTTTKTAQLQQPRKSWKSCWPLGIVVSDMSSLFVGKKGIIERKSDTSAKMYLPVAPPSESPPPESASSDNRSNCSTDTHSSILLLTGEKRQKNLGCQIF